MTTMYRPRPLAPALQAKLDRSAVRSANRDRSRRIGLALANIAAELERAREVRRQASLGGAEHTLETRLLGEVAALRVDLDALEI